MIHLSIHRIHLSGASPPETPHVTPPPLRHEAAPSSRVRGKRFHRKGETSPSGGRGVKRPYADGVTVFDHIPQRKWLGHTPPPPRPNNRLDDIVAVDANRCVRDSYLPVRRNGRRKFSIIATNPQEKICQLLEKLLKNPRIPQSKLTQQPPPPAPLRSL